MSKRLWLFPALALTLTTVVSPPLAAHEKPLRERVPGEVRLRLAPEQLGMADLAVAGPAEVALRIFEKGARITGELDSPLGRLGFRSFLATDGRTRIEHDLADGRGTLSLLVDLQTRTAEVLTPEGISLTPADRFAFRALAAVLASEIGDGSAETDLLLRATRLWGDHPLQPVRLERIVAPREKSWTNLCGVTSATLRHDATNHGLIAETLATGPRADNCRSRCGAGCDA
ncbi:MAG: hypothetical protein ACLGI9_22200, partial [Thermoanaerobaculia bacterium]